MNKKFAAIIIDYFLETNNNFLCSTDKLSLLICALGTQCFVKFDVARISELSRLMTDFSATCLDALEHEIPGIKNSTNTSLIRTFNENIGWAVYVALRDHIEKYRPSRFLDFFNVAFRADKSNRTFITMLGVARSKMTPEEKARYNHLLEIFMSGDSSIEARHEAFTATQEILSRYGIIFDQTQEDLEHKLQNYIDENFVHAREINFCGGTLQEIPNFNEIFNAVHGETFSEMLLRLINESGEENSAVYNRANIDRKHFNKIANHDDYQPSKKTVLSFALALRLDLEKTKDLLGAAGFSLSNSSLSDVIVKSVHGETFSEMLLRLINESGEKNSAVYNRANIDRKHFNKIANHDDYQPSKKTVLSFALALRLDLEKTKDLLGAADFSLSNSNLSDVIVKFFIERKLFEINQVNEYLSDYNQPLLGNVCK